MILQPCSPHPNVSISSTRSYSSRLSVGFRSITLSPSTPRSGNAIACSKSETRSYGTVDYEKRSYVKWNPVYKKISYMENPELGSGTVLDQCEKEGKKLTKWDLSRVIKELRKYKRYKLALEVYEWMNKREESFRISTSDTAIELDLIAKVRGITNAEDYFVRLPDKLKDRRIYGALLNAYARSRKREKAELLLNLMKTKGYVTSALPYNVVMTLYMNISEYDKVESTIAEMMEKNIQLDIYSYNIWLSSRGSQGSSEKMEQVFDQMKLDRTISPNWTTFSTMATMYIKIGQFEKAEECLKKVETRIVGRDRIPYHYLITLYGNTGNKDEVYRVWNMFKSNFPKISNSGYHAVISSLARIGDLKGAEKIYEEWLIVKSKYDARIGNVLMGWYVKEGSFEKAEEFYDHMVEVGGKPNSATFEILAERHIREGSVTEALCCFRSAVSAEGSQNWRPRLSNVTLIFNKIKDEGDKASMQDLTDLLREKGCFRSLAFASLFGVAPEHVTNNGPSVEKDQIKDEIDNELGEEDGAEMLLNQLQGSM